MIRFPFPCCPNCFSLTPSIIAVTLKIMETRQLIAAENFISPLLTVDQPLLLFMQAEKSAPNPATTEVVHITTLRIFFQFQPSFTPAVTAEKMTAAPDKSVPTPKVILILLYFESFAGSGLPLSIKVLYFD